MRGDYGVSRSFLVMSVSPLLEFCRRERGTCMEENGSVLRSIEAWEEGPRRLRYACIYTPMFIAS